MTSESDTTHLRASTPLPDQRWLVALQAFAILAAGWFAFSPALRGDWLWDDEPDILQNQLLRTPAGLAEVWLKPGSLTDYYPLKSTVQWLQWQLWQEHTPGYHLTNLGLHLLSAFLLWRLLRQLGLRLAWLGGLLFVMHPLAVESVAWIAELKNTLSLPPLLLALGAFIDYDERGRRAGYFLSVALFLAAMLCKTSVVMFPAVLLLYCWWKRGRLDVRDWLATVPFFAISLVLGLVTVSLQHQLGIGDEIFSMGSWFARLTGAGLIVAHYFSECIFPASLMPIYPRWSVDSPSLLQLLPWPVLAATFGWLWTRRATWGRHALFGLGWFLLNLAPFLGLTAISYMRFTWTMDHLTYLPLLGLIGLATAGAGVAVDRLAPNFRLGVFAGIAVLVVLLATETRRHAAIFRDSETFWSHAVAQNPDAWLAHNNLGSALLKRREFATAGGHFEQALRLRPDYALAHYNLADALMKTAAPAAALSHYEEAVRLRPGFHAARYNLGNTLVALHRPDEAIPHFEQVLRLKPDHADAHNNLGHALFLLHRPREAVAQFEAALKLQPARADTLYNLGAAWFELGDWTQAVGQFEEAVRLQPEFPEALCKLATAQSRLGRLPEAVANFERALHLTPDSVEAHYNLGAAQFQLGHFAAALPHFEATVRLQPDLTAARESLELTRKQLLQSAAPPGK